MTSSERLSKEAGIALSPACLSTMLLKAEWMVPDVCEPGTEKWVVVTPPLVLLTVRRVSMRVEET